MPHPTGGYAPIEQRPLAAYVYGPATRKVSRLLAKDKVTSALRAPFTRFLDPAGHGELEEPPYSAAEQRT